MTTRIRRGLLVLLLLLPGALSAQAGAPAARSGARFWRVIDAAREGAPGCEAIAERLEHLLRALPDSSLEAFAQGWADWWQASYRWDLWGAAYIINGGSSDDGFDYFRGWLLTRGSARWRRAARNPDTAFDDAPAGEAECEDILGALPTVYEDRFGRDAPEREMGEPSGTEWTEATLPARFPHLSRRFGAAD